MILSQTAEYALRAMAWLALHADEGPYRAVDLSEQAEIPSPYLSKILRRLVIARLLHSRKGHGGGFSLARPPEEIRFVDILVAVDTVPPSGACAFGWGKCDAEKPCPLHGAWSKISVPFQAWLEDTTLADLDPVNDEWRKIRIDGRETSR